MSAFSSLKIAIVGRQKDTTNYENALKYFDVSADVLLSVGSLHNYDGLILPGGGDITLAFYGQKI